MRRAEVRTHSTSQKLSLGQRFAQAFFGAERQSAMTFFNRQPANHKQRKRKRIALAKRNAGVRRP